MKIGLAQTRPAAGDIDKNIESHKRLIELAVVNNADAVFFPELSITGYEPKLARQLATNKDDKRFDDFQKISDSENITIGIGAPTIGDTGILISMIFFQPNSERLLYSKQLLHSDELPYFTNGSQQMILTVGNKKIAPAICYESLQPEHSTEAFKNGAEIYVASVAKSANGIGKALNYFPIMAKQYSKPVLMTNCIGKCDDFESMGSSAVWNKDGLLSGQLNDSDEGLIIFDTETEQIITTD